MYRAILKPGRGKSLLRRHPWIFSGAVARIDGGVAGGDTVEVYSANGRWLAKGGFSERSQIRIRVWTFDRDETVDAEYFLKRISSAVDLRSRLFRESDTNAYRLVHGESDGLPGLVVDRYADVLVCQFLSAGIERWRDEVIEQLQGLFPHASMYERSEGESREKEGLPARTGPMPGSGDITPVEILENSRKFLVDTGSGQKTGFYLDQRANRRLLEGYALNADVLNCFSYTGGFAVSALAGGARSVVNIETSLSALDLGLENIRLNGLNTETVENLQGDVFGELRRFRDSRKTFDLIVLDPPKFAASASQIEKAARGYKDINLLAMKLLRPGGLLFTFSCSGHIVPDLFQKIVADAAVDAQRSVRFLHRLGQGPDHPVLSSFPESHYLKGFVCEVE